MLILFKVNSLDTRTTSSDVAAQRNAAFRVRILFFFSDNLLHAFAAWDDFQCYLKNILVQVFCIFHSSS